MIWIICKEQNTIILEVDFSFYIKFADIINFFCDPLYFELPERCDYDIDQKGYKNRFQQKGK